MTGRGGNILVIDDPLKPQEAHSESARESLKQWYANTLLSRLDNKREGAIIVVMQRLHPDDLVGYLLQASGWEHLNLPAIAEHEMTYELGGGRSYCRKVGELLHPEREAKKELEELKAAMGSLEFSAQYQQSPIPASGNLIKWPWLQFYDCAPQPSLGDQIILSWDTAMTSSELSDFSVAIVALVRKGRVYILDVIRDRLEYPELRRAVIELSQRWGRWGQRPTTLIEKKGSGLSLIQDLARDHIHVIGVLPEGDKVMRMSAQTAFIEAGAVYLPKQAPWLNDFRAELLAFPVSKHDDQVDALSQALLRANRPYEPQLVVQSAW